MKTTVQILRDAKALLETRGWTQGEYARGKSGKPVRTRSAAVCFCAVGAISFAAGAGPDEDCGIDAIGALGRTIPHRIIPDFNDTPGRTKDEVLAKFDEAIAAEEAKELAAQAVRV